MQVDILFALSDRLHNSKTLIYSDLQSLAPEQYMKQVIGHPFPLLLTSSKVTKRVVDIKLVDRPEDRNWMIVMLEFSYRQAKAKY